MTAIVVERLTHQYGSIKALRDVSFTVESGEIVCLLGPSGCGKTTLLRLIAGLEPVQSGRVALYGRVVADAQRSEPAERRRVGMVFQDQAVFPHLTVAGNVAFGLSHLSSDDRQSRVQAVLQQVGLSAFAPRYPHTLSGGQQQRVALARAVAPAPGVMLLDEPFSSLDPRQRAEIRAEMLALLRANGAAVLFVTHDPEEAMELGDRLAILRNGRLMQCGTPRACYDRPVDLDAALALGDANRFRAVARCGEILTPLGRLPAKGACDGALYEVLVRPEHVELSSYGVPAVVETARFLGPLSQINVGLGGGISARLLVRADCSPAVGDRVHVRFQCGKAIVLPADDLPTAPAGPAEVPGGSRSPWLA